ncbi:MAG: phosphatase PAP2 family protein [Bacteroidales bacterium]|nr:phosphatase PAP2 family protein [Bacteroidales bacterium]
MIRKLIFILILSATCIAQAAELDSIRPLQRTVAAASGLVVNAAATEVLKHTVHKMRPDGSDNHSFPSRHSSWAFAVSTAISTQLGGYNPWWSFGSYAAASAVGFQRVYSHKHFTSDVISGAGIGIASAEIGNLIARAIFRRHQKWGAENDFRPTFGMSSGILWPVGSLNHRDLNAIYLSGIRGSLPLDDNWGESAQLEVATAWSKDGGRMSAWMLNAGLFYRLHITRSLVFEPEIALGYAHLMSTLGAVRSRMVVKPTLSLNYRLTSRWATAFNTGYTSGPVSSIFATISSTVIF